MLIPLDTYNDTTLQDYRLLHKRIDECNRYLDENGHKTCTLTVLLAKRIATRLLHQITLDDAISKSNPEVKAYFDKYKFKDIFTKWQGKATEDEATEILRQWNKSGRLSEYRQRLLREAEVRHLYGWYFVFDNLTINNECLDDVQTSYQIIRNYTRAISHSICRAAGIDRTEHKQVYRYFACPEHGSKNGRLHWHIMHICKHLPEGSVDPNLGNERRHKREIDSFKEHWQYGNNIPIAVRYSGDGFSKLGWYVPIDKKGEAVSKNSSIEATAHYLCKYVTKYMDEDECKKNRKISKTLKHRLSMSRNMGRIFPSLNRLPVNDLTKMSSLSVTESKYALLLRKESRNELRQRILDAGNSLQSNLENSRPKKDILTLLRCMTQSAQNLNLLNLENILTPKYSKTDLSKIGQDYLELVGTHYRYKTLSAK